MVISRSIIEEFAPRRLKRALDLRIAPGEMNMRHALLPDFSEHGYERVSVSASL